MEPSITASLDLFAPFGSSPANGKAQLKGSFGNAVLDNIPDYYSQLLTKVESPTPSIPRGNPLATNLIRNEKQYGRMKLIRIKINIDQINNIVTNKVVYIYQS